MKALAISGALVAGALSVSAAQAADQEYNVFAIPSQEIVDLVADTAERMGEYDLETFYARGYVPHATLYLTSFRESDLPTVKAKIEEMASGMSSFPLEIKGTHLTGGRWFFLDIAPNVKLQALSDEFVTQLMDLRNPDYEIPSWAANIPAKAASFERYGSPNVFSQYNPHLTQLASEESPRLDDFIATLSEGEPAVIGRVVGVGFAPVNPLGQAKQGDETVFFFPDAK